MRIKRQVTVNIEELDKKIGVLNKELDAAETYEDYETIMTKLESLTDLRCKLATSRVENSTKSVIVGGLLSVASLVVVLQYENENVITTKAFGMLPNMFRGSK